MTRLERLRKHFAPLSIDGLLVTDSRNIRYLTGFNLMSGDGCLLVTPDYAILITDDRYKTALKEFDSDEVEAVITRDYYGSVAKLAKHLPVPVLGFEGTLPYQIYDVLDDLLESDLVPLNNVVEGLRRQKEPDELTAIKKAASLQSAAYKWLLKWVKPGMREREVANRLDAWMREHGAERASFNTIVASGPNSAKPHWTAGERQLQEHDPVTLDFGYFVNGYTADMTRTFFIGKPTDQLTKVYNLVNQARQAVIEQIRPGARGDQLDRAGRSLIEHQGFGDYFQHGMGHGIGLAIHELPASYGPTTKHVHLKTNEVVTVEPGIYIPDVGGVRIEDDVVVTANGCEKLTTASTELFSVPID